MEVDGRSHDGRRAQDAARQVELESRGYRVVRVTNDGIIEDLDQVVQQIESLAQRSLD